MAHPLFRLAPLFRRSKRLLLLGVVGLLLGSGLNLIGPWIIAQAIDGDLQTGNKQGLVGKAMLYVGVLIANMAVRYWCRIALEVSAQRAMFGLKRKLFSHLVDHDLAFFDRHNSGKLITRVQGDTESLRVLFTDAILQFPADLTLFVGMFVVISMTAPEVAPLVFSVIPPYIVLFIVFRRVSPPRFLRVRKVTAKLTGFLTEHLRAMPILQLFGRGSWVNRKSETLNEEVYRAERIAHLIPVGYFNCVILIRALGIVLLLWVGAGLVADGVLTVGVLVMGLAYLRQMFDPLFRLSFHVTTIEKARAAAIRIGDILDTAPTVTDPEKPQPWPGLERSIRLEHVSFHYEEGTPVLRDVTLEIPAGWNVGLVGATGAGKSTILNLLLRFRDPISGRVTVDGVDLRDMKVDVVRSKMGLVLQDVHLFRGTVLENLGGDEPAAKRSLETVALDFPLDHMLTDGGSNLSRGERQLLTFARALVLDPQVLVLDEATSAVDPETEARVQKALERLQAGRTTIIVAHRLATVRDCQTIFLFDSGVVREQGTHQELLAAGGLYAALSNLQQANEQSA